MGIVIYPFCLMNFSMLLLPKVSKVEKSDRLEGETTYEWIT
jgi:hypothetical protein